MDESFTPKRTRWFLREWRKHFGLTLEQLADAMGTTKSNNSKLERKRFFKTYWLDRYCAALSPLAKRPITAKDLSTHPDSLQLDDLLSDVPAAEQKRARDILRAFLNGRT
jgi:transcriptional regulator with XRE-family HTH domain